MEKSYVLKVSFPEAVQRNRFRLWDIVPNQPSQLEVAEQLNRDSNGGLEGEWALFLNEKVLVVFDVDLATPNNSQQFLLEFVDASGNSASKSYPVATNANGKGNTGYQQINLH